MYEHARWTNDYLENCGSTHNDLGYISKGRDTTRRKGIQQVSHASHMRYQSCFLKKTTARRIHGRFKQAFLYVSPPLQGITPDSVC